MGKRGYQQVTDDDLSPILPIHIQEVVKEAREVWENLRTGRVHSDKGGICIRACCLYPEYLRAAPRGRARKFSPETFYLEWLSHDLLFWFRYREREIVRDGYDEKYVKPAGWEPLKGKSGLKAGAVYIPWSFLRTHRRGLYQKTALFLREFLSDLKLDTSAKRIKLNVWRLQKKGILPELERRILLRDNYTGRTHLGIMHSTFDFLLKRPNYSATRREIIRHLKITTNDYKSIIHGFWGKLSISHQGKRFGIEEMIKPRGSVLYSLKEH